MQIAMKLQSGASRPSREGRRSGLAFGLRSGRSRVLVVARSADLRSTLATFVEQAGLLPVLAANLEDALILQGMGRPIAKVIVAWPEEPVRLWRDKLRSLSDGLPLLLVGAHAPGRGFADIFKRKQATSLAVLSEGTEQLAKRCRDFLAAPEPPDNVISTPAQIEADVIHFDGVEFRPRCREIWVNGNRCVIGAAAFKLALHFFRNPERTVAWNEIALVVGLDGRVGTTTQCRNAVARVRSLLKSHGMPAYTLESVRRQGYCLRPPELPVGRRDDRQVELVPDGSPESEFLAQWQGMLRDLAMPIGVGGCTLGQALGGTGPVLLSRELASS